MRSQVTVRLPKELAAALERTRRRSRRKTSDIVRAALQEYLRVDSGGPTPPAERVQALIGPRDSCIVDLD